MGLLYLYSGVSAYPNFDVMICNLWVYTCGIIWADSVNLKSSWTENIFSIQ
jgi:hypothetical protein